MNTTTRQVNSTLRKYKEDVVAKYKELFKNLKKNGIVMLDCNAWDVPRDSDFKEFGGDAELYMKSLREYIVTSIGDYEANEMFDSPDCYTFVTTDEIKRFKTVIYPKLYAKWAAEQKQKRSENAKSAEKIRAKICKLQRQLAAIKA